MSQPGVCVCLCDLGGGKELKICLTYSPVFDEIAEDCCSNVQAVENRIT